MRYRTRLLEQRLLKLAAEFARFANAKDITKDAIQINESKEVDVLPETRDGKEVGSGDIPEQKAA